MSGETDLDSIFTVIKNNKNTNGSNPIVNGEVLTLQFDIDIPTTGLFDFTLTQSPVREPVSIFPFDIDGLGLLCRRRVPARGGLT
jgi:hypothetical protein